MNVYNIWIKYNVNNNKMNVIIININVIQLQMIHYINN